MYDPNLFALLEGSRGAKPHARLRNLQVKHVVLRAKYFEEFVPRRTVLRRAYFDAMLTEFEHCELIFFDPDNGLEIASVKPGREGSQKFLYRDEIAGTYEAGHSILLYQHFPRERRDEFVGKITSALRRCAPNGQMWAYRTAHVAYFLAIHPRHLKLASIAGSATAGWKSEFMKAERL